MLRQIANILFVALACCFAFWLVWSSLDFQECIKGYSQNENSPERLEKGLSAFVSSFPVLRRCAGAYVTEKKDVISAVGTLVIAIFTVVLGVFTVSLAGSTKRAAMAAESAAKTADKSIELSESASLSVDTWNVENWGTPQLTIKFHIYNSGKNTAEILELICRAPVAVELPDAPNYTDVPRSPPALVAPGARSGSAISLSLSPEQIAAIETGTITLFVYGKITFKSVNFNTIWELGFAQSLALAPANAQGVRIAEFYYPTNPGFNFLRPKT
jgi:hypothetical protein